MSPRRRQSADLTRALDSLRRIVRAGRGTSQAVESRYGVTAAQLFVLQTLAQSPGMSIKDLVGLTLTTNSSVSEVVGRLVDSRLVTRETAEDDRRRKVLTLTEAGREILRNFPRAMQQDLIEGFKQLPQIRQRLLASALAEWCRLSGFAALPPTMFFEPARTGASPPKRKGRGRVPASPRR